MGRTVLKHLGYFLGYGTLGIVVAAVAAFGVYVSHLPEPRIWHTAPLDAEFRAADAERVRTLADYRALEDRLFSQLREQVYDRVPGEDRRQFNRYAAGSLADPMKQAPNWNRTFELDAAAPRGSVLLLHGLSDSPYSMRALAESLHARGYRVVGLRLPGHGTAPSGLLRVHWQDMAAAVRLAARDLARRAGPGKPLYLVGYSTGASLAVEYALARLQGEDLPPVERLVLLSPAMGVSPAAALAVWEERLGTWLGVPRLAWTDLAPEYDPYKYASFTARAGDQVYALTQVIAQRFAALGKSGAVTGMPRVLTFQSVADDTVSAPAVVNALFRHLANEGHELVVFDINRYAQAADLFAPAALKVKENLLAGPALPFDLTVITNRDGTSFDLDAVRRAAGGSEVVREATKMSWPRGVFSLSHVALPFSPDDPIYGATRPARRDVIFLGRPELLGERGLLAVSPGNLMRLRHNPFFDYVDTRVAAHFGAN